MKKTILNNHKIQALDLGDKLSTCSRKHTQKKIVELMNIANINLCTPKITEK